MAHQACCYPPITEVVETGLNSPRGVNSSGHAEADLKSSATANQCNRYLSNSLHRGDGPCKLPTGGLLGRCGGSAGDAFATANFLRRPLQLRQHFPQRCFHLFIFQQLASFQRHCNPDAGPNLLFPCRPLPFPLGFFPWLFFSFGYLCTKGRKVSHENREVAFHQQLIAIRTSQFLNRLWGLNLGTRAYVVFLPWSFRKLTIGRLMRQAPTPSTV